MSTKSVGTNASEVKGQPADVKSTRVPGGDIGQKISTKSTKAETARQIFDEEWRSTNGKPIRKNVISRFVSEAKLTPKGAGTYYFNIKKKYMTNKT